MASRFSAIVVVGAVLAMACGSSDPAGRQEGAADRGGGANRVAAPNQDPPSDDTEEGAGTCDASATNVKGWPTYENGHFSFQAPATLHLAFIGTDVPVVVTKDLKDNTDPSVSKYVFETQLNQTTALAYWFVVDVGEIASPGTTAEGLATVAAMPQGLPPSDRAHNHECGVTESRATTYACDPAVEWTNACNTIRGYSYQWSRIVYHGARTFEISCAGSGIVTDKAEICAKVLASLQLHD